MVGHIHSIESFGTVDGPGVRLVIFTKGCPMRCLYCHNPDTWDINGGTDITVEDILEKYESSKPYYKTGGITVSGGEPLMQTPFITELFEAAKAKNIHTCLDTSGITFNPKNTDNLLQLDRLLKVTDLVLLDIKHIDPIEHLKLCGQPLEHILEFAHYLDNKNISVWIRHVVVPGITDNDDYLYQLGLFIGTLKNVKALDVLPYHNMGEVKYKKLGMDYLLKGVAPLGKKETINAKSIILKGIQAKRKELQEGKNT